MLDLSSVFSINWIFFVGLKFELRVYVCKAGALPPVHFSQLFLEMGVS
jgi:hypothetical protein